MRSFEIFFLGRMSFVFCVNKMVNPVNGVSFTLMLLEYIYIWRMLAPQADQKEKQEEKKL